MCHGRFQPENSPLNVGMAPASWRNSYYAGDASTPWTMQFYDYEGSLNVPDVSPVDPTLNEYVVLRYRPRARVCLISQCSGNQMQQDLGSDGIIGPPYRCALGR